DLLDRVKPRPDARYIVFHAADFNDDEVEFYGSLDLRQARHPQAILAYEMNNRPLTVRHGAPLRLKVPNQLGYKNTKFIYKVSLVADLRGHGEGRGGYWEDAGYEHFGGI
ncbi:MAG: molybdopterin-dependent oxidoreductase, partial [Candidatus Sericytochromatia bacterium]|nr:molybdopterin-dependent oxidoreductase [Candidatus Tanganyikabacteria bacterium]